MRKLKSSIHLLLQQLFLCTACRLSFSIQNFFAFDCRIKNSKINKVWFTLSIFCKVIWLTNNHIPTYYLFVQRLHSSIWWNKQKLRPKSENRFSIKFGKKLLSKAKNLFYNNYYYYNDSKVSGTGSLSYCNFGGISRTLTFKKLRTWNFPYACQKSYIFYTIEFTLFSKILIC